MFKKIILCAVLLYSAMAELCAQNCATCVGGDIAQCPVGTPHDVRNVYMCFKTESTLGFDDSGNCPLSITNATKTTFTPHKSIVIHKQVNLVFPSSPGQALSIDMNTFPSPSTSNILLNQVQTVTFQLQPGINIFNIFWCPTGDCESDYLTATQPITFSFQIEYKENPVSLYDSSKKPDEIWEFTIPANGYDHPTQTPYSGQSAGLAIATPGSASAYIKYGGTIGVMDKPLVFVDGIDFSQENYTDESVNVNGSTYQSKTIRHGSTGWDIFVTGREESKVDITSGQVETFGKYPTEIQKMRDAGYDIILLDFANGATYMEKNAALLIKLLEKLQDYSSDITVIGASMGGQISRYALTKMESQNKKHCVSQYVSFDSPNQGANIPLFMQGTAWALHDYQVNGQSAVPDPWRAINLPAALQLLKEPFQSAVNAGKIILLTGNDPFNIPKVQATGFVSGNNYRMRNNFVAKLEQQGSYSTNARNIAISCGSINGTPQKGLGVVGGEKVYGVDLTAKFKILPKITMSSIGLFTLNGISSTNITYGQVHKGNGSYGVIQNGIPAPRAIIGLALPDIALTKAALDANCLENPVPIPKIYIAQTATSTTFQAEDNAPGGYRDDLIRTVDDYVSLAQGFLKNDKFSIVKNPSTPLFNSCFISTISALDLKGFGLFSDLFPLDAKILAL